MYQSKSVDSNQDSIHENLESTVLKHIKHPFLKPIREHNQLAFMLLKEKVTEFDPEYLIMDSCCGTAMSTMILAERNPKALVVGVDQSIHRLEKCADPRPDNVLLLQANCEDLWRLCLSENILFDEHFILYPNPWPKSTQMKRRWHGHAVFPVLNKLAKKTTLRSNWKLYLEEFAFAWLLLTERKYVASELQVQEALTLFEKKYAGSQQRLFELELMP